MFRRIQFLQTARLFLYLSLDTFLLSIVPMEYDRTVTCSIDSRHPESQVDGLTLNYETDVLRDILGRAVTCPRPEQFRRI